MPGRMSAEYEPSTGMRDSQYRPPAPISAPATITGLVPIRAKSCDEIAGDDDDATECERQVGHAGLDRRVVEHALHVQRQEEEHREEAGQGDHLRGVGGRDSLDAQDRQRDERVGAPAAR